MAEPTETGLVEAITFVVEEAWNGPYSTKSDFARAHASEVAAAACLGYITTAVKFTKDHRRPKEGVEEFGSLWRITLRGSELLAGKGETE